MAHHPFSPSKLERLESCPGSYTLSQDVVDMPTEAAEQGTALHGSISLDVALGDHTEEEKELVLKCRAFKEQLIAWHPEAKRWNFEEPVKLVDGFEVLTEGTADLVGYAPAYVVIADWKFGYKEVTPAAANLQVRTYAAGVMQAHRVPRAFVYIFQARTGRHTVACMEMAEYENVVRRVQVTRRACLSERLVLNPNDENCAYCPAKAICPALKARAGELARVHSSQLSDPDAMGKLLTFAKMVKKWVDSVEYHAKALALRSGGLPGYHLRPRKGNRTINDAQKCYDLLSLYLTPTEFIAACKVDVGALEEAFIKERKEADSTITLKQAKTEFETLLLPVIERGSETLTLVAQ